MTCTRVSSVLAYALAVTLALPLPVEAPAQAPARQPVAVPTVAPRPEDVGTLDGIMRAFYEVISGPAGQPRQWARDRSLYIPGVRFVANDVRQGQPHAEVMDHQAFVDQADSGLVHDGFYEREIHRDTHTYGNITHVFSTYEMRRTPNGPAFGRGINSIELFWDGKRWWIAGAIWFDEDREHPIPKEYLP